MVLCGVNTANQGDGKGVGGPCTCLARMVREGSPEEGPLVLKLKDILIPGNGQAAWTCHPGRHGSGKTIGFYRRPAGATESFPWE